MKKYFVDTNVFLRFLLKDNKKHFQEAKKYFTQAKQEKIALILIPQVVFEINYVLKEVYSLPKKERVDLLAKLVKSPTLEVKNRPALIFAVQKFRKLNVNLFDIYLAELSKQNKARVLSFDKDFEKIEKK